MHHLFFLRHFIEAAAGSSILLPLALALGVFFLEDSTVIIAGILVADGILPFALALGSLYLGIIIGDLVLYGIGRLARTHPRLERYVSHEFVAPFRAWIETRFVLTVFSARFIPGARLPTYTASGFFRSELSRFILTTTAATAVWTTFLFSISYWFGNATSTWVGPVRWGIALFFILVLFLIAHYNVRRYQTEKSTFRAAASPASPDA